MKFIFALLLFFGMPHILCAADVPAFTDQDLDRYKKSSDVYKPSGKPSAKEVNSEKIAAVPGEQDNVQKAKRIEVPYKANEGNARRVIVMVQFNDSVTAPMLLDTGSPGMMISYDLADKLGLFHKDNARLVTAVGGIGGTAPGIITIMDTVQMGEAKDYFVPTTISASLSEEFEGLVGMDFMSNYTVQVDIRRKVVVFEELPPRGSMPGGHDEEWWRLNFRQFASLRSQWQQVKERLRKWLDAKKDLNINPNEVPRLRRFIELQNLEADKLFDKLNGYAVRNSVPMQWRTY
jgi:hypothetical protein